MNNKRTTSRFFGSVTLATQLGFYLFKVNNNNNKNTIKTGENEKAEQTWFIYEFTVLKKDSN